MLHLSKKALEMLAMMFSDQSPLTGPFSHAEQILEIRHAVQAELAARAAEAN